MTGNPGGAEGRGGTEKAGGPAHDVCAGPPGEARRRSPLSGAWAPQGWFQSAQYQLLACQKAQAWFGLP